MAILSAMSNYLKTNPTYNAKSYLPGTIVSGKYLTASRDKNPTVLILFSGIENTKIRGKVHITHGINLHYLNNFQLQQLSQIIISLSKSKFPVNMVTFYDSIKHIAKDAYRTYFTAYLIAKVVSPGFYRAPIAIMPTNEQYINMLNSQLIPSETTYENKFRGEDEINAIIEQNQDRSNRMTGDQGIDDE